MADINPIDTNLTQITNNVHEEGDSATKIPVRKKRGDQSDLVQGLRIVYDTLAPQSKKGDQSADIRKGKSKGSATDSSEVIDIIAVPGLGADPLTTWLKRSRIDNKKLGDGQRSDRPAFKDGPSCIEDRLMLQAELPNSRIMIFQYVSQWWGESAVDQYLHQVAENLARALKNKRKNCPKRPIIFIGHSLGGIVIEKTILWAKLEGLEYADVFDSITGCIFLGTPFTGSESQAYAAVIAHALSMNGMEKAKFNSLLEVLKSGNQYLVSLLDDFLKIVTESGILTHCFIELRKTNLTKFLRGLLSFASVEKIVASADSATLRGRPKTSLNLDHSGLNKFDGPTDENWITVYNELKDMARKSAKIIKSRQNALPDNLDDSKYHEILGALSLSERDPDDDIFSIKEERGDAIDATSKLVLENEMIAAFLKDEQPGALWIDTHSGMDTAMMAVAIHQELDTIRKRNSGDQNDRQLCYFFCDDTDLKKNNTLSILKAFIRQMVAHTRRLALHLPWNQKSSKGRVSFESAATLMEPFLAMLRDTSIGNVYILINNIHMVDEDDRSELLHTFFMSIAKHGKSKEINADAKVKWICIGQEAERLDLKNAMQIAKHITSTDLGSPEKLRDALKTLVAQRVRRLADSLGYRRDIMFWLRTELLRRAEGNVTWVDIACSEIHCVRPSPINVRSFAESLRQGLIPLYRQITKRVLHTTHDTIEYTKEILRTMMIVVQHPTPNELSVLANLPSELHDQTEEIIDIIKQCGSFLMIKKDPKRKGSLRVEFIDVSAREFLRRESAAVLGLSSEQVQHGVLALRCLSYLREVPGGSGEQQRFTSFPEHRGREASSNITYPSRYWINHAIKAADTDVVEDFDLEDNWWHDQKAPYAPWWPRLSELARKIPSVKGLTAVHLAAYFDYRSLLRQLLESDLFKKQLYSEDSLGHQPLTWAVREGHLESTKVLIEYGADIHATSEVLKDGLTAIHVAIQAGRLDLVQYLVSHGADLNSPAGAALCIAAAKGSNDIVTYLLSSDTSLTAPMDCPYGNAVGAACMSGNNEVIRALVKKGCVVNVKDEDGVFPLQRVANNPEAVSLLMAHGANKEHIQAGIDEAFNHADNITSIKQLLEKSQELDLRGPFLKAAYHGQHELFPIFPKAQLTADLLTTALLAASASGSAATVQSLLKMGADPNRKGRENAHGHALTVAAKNGSTEIIRMLLNAKANPGVVDERHGTALQAACFEGNIDNVRLLLKGNKKDAPPCEPFGSDLCAAILGHHKEVVELLLSQGWNVNDDNGERGGPILIATAEARLDILEILFKYDVDVKVANELGMTPLILGARSLPTRGIKMLIERGCDITEQNMDKINPLIAATMARATESVQVLLDLGAKRGFFQKRFDINHISAYGSALHIAIGNGDAQTCHVLIRGGASLRPDVGKFPPLMYVAARSGDLETFELISELCEHHPIKYEKKWGDILAPAIRGRNPDIYGIFLDDTNRNIDALLDERDETALYIACLYDLPDLVEELLDKGADPNVKSGKYHTTLQAAAYRGNPDVVRMLLNQGVEEPSSPGGFYHNALNAAASKNHVVVMRMLMEAAKSQALVAALFHAVKSRAIHAVSLLLHTILLDKEAKLDAARIPFDELEQLLDEELDEEMENSDDGMLEIDDRVDPEDQEQSVEELASEDRCDQEDETVEEGGRYAEHDRDYFIEDIRQMLNAAARRVL